MFAVCACLNVCTFEYWQSAILKQQKAHKPNEKKKKKAASFLRMCAV